jgi:hypothetical protein
MAHCPPELLDDLADLLADLRTWPGVVEKRPFVFYVRRQPFLHFHLVEGRRRRADIRERTGWVQLDLPRPISPVRRRALRRALRAQYEEREPS